MAKKKWTLVLGASVVAGLVGLRQLTPAKKKQAEREINLHRLITLYAKKWTFLHQNGQVISLVITEDLSLVLNERAIPTTVLELTPNRLALVDEYGYHLVLSHDVDRLGSHHYQLYDEADDQSYSLEEQ